MVADGDVAINAIVEKHFGRSVPVNRDPNHYVKGLLKNIAALSATHPKVAELGPVLKAHFLRGTTALVHASQHFWKLISGVFHNTGVKLHRTNEEGFTLHMRLFIPHITNTSHQGCTHPANKVTIRADPVEVRLLPECSRQHGFCC